MAVVSSGSAQDSKSFKLATGPLKMKDVLINPTLQELNDYGVAFKEEPNYLVDDQERGKGVVITIWAKVDPSNFNAEDANALGEYQISQRIYLFNSKKVSQGGKPQFVNKYGDTTYAENIDLVPDWFKTDKMREAYQGEDQLLTFIKTWGDLRQNKKTGVKDECFLETIPAICNGDFSELKELEGFFKTHKFIGLVGLKDKGDNKFVPVIYGKEYWRVYSIGIWDKDKNATIPFEVGLPVLLSDSSKSFNKADIITYVPKIWDSSELKSVQPDSEDAPQQGQPQTEDLF